MQKVCKIPANRSAWEEPHHGPTYRKHSATGRAVVSVRRPEGTRTETFLPGKFGSRESRDAYDNLLARLRSNGGSLPGPSGRDDITIAELALKFMEHANGYYRHPVSKEPTGEAAAFGEAFRPFCRLYADTPATAFALFALPTLRTALFTDSWLNDEERILRAKNKRPVGLARTTTNRHVARIKQQFKWGSSVELVPASIHAALETVAGLRLAKGKMRVVRDLDVFGQPAFFCYRRSTDRSAARVSLATKELFHEPSSVCAN